MYAASCHNSVDVDSKLHTAVRIVLWSVKISRKRVHYQIATFLGEAYQNAKAVAAATAVNGFIRTDLFPSNRHILGESGFL